MDDPLKMEFEFFLQHRKELLEKYRGKAVIIKDQQVRGAYATERDAVNEGMKLFKLGTFLVQICSDEEGSFRRSFHTRVAFAV